MDTVNTQALADWIFDNARAGKKKLYFTINGDIPLTNGSGSALYYQIPIQGKLVCVLHPDHLTSVAQICYQAGIQMVQVLL